MYLTVTIRSSDQTTSDSAPKTCGSVAVSLWLPTNTCWIAYRGLVPMSP